jgi:hypothetical protein
MKTKIQNLFIALPVLLLLLPAVVQAQDAYSTNADGSIYTYSTNADGSANIVAYAGPPWVVTIPTNINGLTVTSIGFEAFENPNLTSVTIPDSVISIGERAFFGCTKLTNVTILTGVTSIGGGAFEHCISLTSVTIPNSVTSIGNSAFVQCLSLTSVTIPNSVTTIGDYAFEECSGLTSITIPNSVTSIGDEVFLGCSSLTSINVDAANPAYSSMNGVLFDKPQATLLQFPEGLGGSYTIPNSVTSVGEEAFYGSGLTSVTIPGSITSIGQEAFFDCYNLTNAVIDNGVTSIGVDAFAVTSLTSVTIPSSVTSIGQEAFFDCTSLTTAYFLGNEPPDDGTVFNGDPATVYYLSGTTGWGSTFGSVPAVLWNPQAITPGFAGGQFGFNLIGPTNAVIVIEACTNLSHPVWLPVSTNTLSALGASAFSDPQSGGYPIRFYRFRSQ